MATQWMPILIDYLHNRVLGASVFNCPAARRSDKRTAADLVALAGRPTTEMASVAFVRRTESLGWEVAAHELRAAPPVLPSRRLAKPADPNDYSATACKAALRDMIDNSFDIPTAWVLALANAEAYHPFGNRTATTTR